MKTKVKTDQEIIYMRQSGKILAECLKEATKIAKPGVKTIEIDRLVRELTLSRGGRPAFLGYQGFPNSICISINDEIVHGIPSDKILKEGDIVGLDYGVSVEGMITDSAVTIPVGKVTKQAAHLMEGTKKALEAGISQIKNGVHTQDIGSAIEKSLRSDNLRVVYNLGGHGVGHKVHEDPFVPNFGSPGQGPILKSGMTVAIEPNVSISSNDFFVANDNWTCKTADGSLAAQFEHTVLVTDDGCEILTM